MTDTAGATDVKMPRLSDSMERGVVLSWLKTYGERVEAGEDLVEIETDKATMTYQAEDSGYLAIVVPAGAEADVDALIARLLPEPTGEHGNGPRPDRHIESGMAAGLDPDEGGSQAVRQEESAAEIGQKSRRLRVSPLARRVAEAHDVPLGSVSGSGPGGRIVVPDVRRAAGIPDRPRSSEPSSHDQKYSSRAAPAPRLDPGPLPARKGRVTASASGPTMPLQDSGSAKGRLEATEPTRVQQVIARRMAEAKATIPEFSMRVEVDAGTILAMRAELKKASGNESAPSINDFVIKAAAATLRRHPKVNGAYRDGRFELYERVNVGVAVAVPDALYVPTVFDADLKSIGEIARTTRSLAERGRAGGLSPPELSGGTFTISNLGMYGITDFVPIINPPHAAILAVGALHEALARVDGEIVDQHRMPMTLVADHRILNGAEAAEFLADLRGRLEQPLSTLVA